LDRRNSYDLEVTSSAGIRRMRKWLKSPLFITWYDMGILDKPSAST
jgi:hypothetical protein